MAVKTPVRLAGPANVATGPATVYTVPGSTRAVVRYVHVSNPSESPATFTLSVGNDAAATRIYADESVPAGGRFERHVFIPLAADEVLQASSGTNNALKLTIGGTEEAA